MRAIDLKPARASADGSLTGAACAPVGVPHIPPIQTFARALLAMACAACGRIGYEPLSASAGLDADAGFTMMGAADARALDASAGADVVDAPAVPGPDSNGATADAAAADAPLVVDAAPKDAATTVVDTRPADPCTPPAFNPSRAPAAGCPAGYALVPGKLSSGIGRVDRDFCAPRFEMKAVNNNGQLVAEGRASGMPEQLPLAAHHPESRPDGKPWRFISQKQAKAKCESLGASYHLMTNDEWMTIALQLEASAWTWSSCTVGMGNLPTGWGGLPVTDLNNPYSDTGATAASPWGQGGEKRRALSLSNGEVLWDFNNFAEWLEVTFNGKPVLLSVQAGDGLDSAEGLPFEFDSLELLQVIGRSYGDTQVPPRFIALDTQMMLPATSKWDGMRWVGANSARGFGLFYAKHEYRPEKALMRGWSGMFHFNVYEYDGFDTWDAVGFRCVRDLP